VFHSLTLAKQILTVCSYTLEKCSPDGGSECSSGGSAGTRCAGAAPRLGTGPQPLPGQAWPTDALEVVLPSWHPLRHLPVTSTTSLCTNLMANVARSERADARAGQAGCPCSELPWHPAWTEGTQVGDPKAHPTPGPARRITHSDRHVPQTSFSSPRFLPSAGFYSRKHLRMARGRLQCEHRGDEGRKARSCRLPSIARAAAGSSAEQGLCCQGEAMEE